MTILPSADSSTEDASVTTDVINADVPDKSEGSNVESFAEPAETTETTEIETPEPEAIHDPGKYE